MLPAPTSYRCSFCNINYPTIRTRSDACGEPCTFGRNGTVSDDWQERVAVIRELRESNEEADDVVRIIPTDHLREHDGQHWIHSWDEVHLHDGQEVSIGGLLFEVAGWRESTREWWVQPLVLDA